MPTVTLSSGFLEAFAYATQRYEGRVRGNTRVPSIAHAMAVTALVLDLGADEEEATAALLHDIVEDDGGPAALAEIEERWGSRVAQLVEECTDEVEPSGASWPDRKAAYLATMPAKSVAALRILLADKTDNTRTLLRGLEQEGEALFARHTAGDRETFLWYYEGLVAQFGARADELGASAAPLLAELTRVVEALRHRSA